MAEQKCDPQADRDSRKQVAGREGGNNSRPGRDEVWIEPLAAIGDLVEMQGGRIWFESEYRKGTTFHFTIPVAEG